MSTRPGSVFQFTIWQHSSLLDEVARPDHLFITDGLSSNDLINYANAIRDPETILRTLRGNISSIPDEIYNASY